MQKKEPKIIEMVRQADGTYIEGKPTIKAQPAKIQRSKKQELRQRQRQPIITSHDVVQNIIQDLEEIGEEALTSLISSFRFFR